MTKDCRKETKNAVWGKISFETENERERKQKVEVAKILNIIK
jgi:hypothetical protein